MWGDSFTINFYDSNKLSSTSGTGLTNNNYTSFVSVADGLTAKNVVTGVSVTGTVQYGKNGGLTFGTGTATASSSHKVTFSIGNDYKVTKCTVYAAAYETGRILLNGNAAGSGTLAAKGTTIENITTPYVWTNLNNLTSLEFTKDNGSGGNQKRITIYKIVCEYASSISSKTLSSIAVSGTPTKTTYEDGEALDPAGLVVTGTYSDSSTGTITEGVSWTFNPTTLTEGTTSCTATATVGSISSSAYSVTGLTVNAATKYAATFYVNGSQLSTANYKEGEAVAFPATDPDSPNEDVVFIGWKQGDAISGTTDTKPELVTSATMGTNALTFHAVFASVEDGGSVYKLVTSLTEGKNYVFATRNTAGNGYALASTVTTGTSVTVAASGDDMIISGTPTNSIVWTRGAKYEKISSSFDLQNVGTTTVHLKINGTNVSTADAAYPTFWDSSKGLYGKSNTGTGSNSYYLQNSNGTFSKGNGSTSNRVYAYEEFSSKIYSNYCTTVADAPVLSSIAITTAPNKTKYKVGEVFDGTGMVVTATYEGGSTKTIASSKYTISKTTALATSDASITVSYKEGEVTKTATQTINVLALDHLTIATAPTKVTYEEGEKLAIAGMVVKGTWGTGETTIEEPITGYTTDPADGATLTFENTKFTVSYTHEGITKTVDQAITVTEPLTCSINFFINSATPTVKQAKKGAAVDVPQVIAPVGFEFMGWANAVLAETTKAPASYAIAKDATSYIVTADGANFYAVYKKIETTEYEGGFTLSFTDGEYIRYAGIWGSSYLAKVDDVSDAEIFFLEDDYLYYHASVGGAKTYLYNTGDNTTLSSSTTKPENSWTVTTNNENGTITFQSKATGNRYLAYNTSQPRFATYKNTNYTLNKVDGKTKNVYSYSYSTSATVSALSSIAITTAPTKTDYFAGDDFDKAGMVVKATYENGKTRTVTDNVTIENSTNLTAGTNSLTVSYTENEVIKTTTQAITVTAIELSSIEITTAPTKVTYLAGENFDATGMVVRAHYNDSRKDKEITTYTVTDGESLAIGKETVTISYTEGGITKTTTQAITVNSALQSIAITTNPTKMEYIEGESFDKTGMVVTATYANGETKEVETYTVTPEGALNTVGTQTMTVYYTENGTEKTATLDVTVNAYPIYSVTFKVKGQDDNVQTETVGKAGVFVPENPANIGDYTFAGWSTTEVGEETTTAPTYITITDGKFFPTEATNVYAVFTTKKDGNKYGFKLSIVDSETTYYIGARSSGNSFFTGVTSAESALTIYEDDGYLYYMNGTTPTYFSGEKEGKADITYQTTKSQPWTFGSTANGVTYKSEVTDRYLACNTGTSHRFATYGTSYPYELTKTASTDYVVVKLDYYTSAPSAAITPTTSFATTTPSIDVLDAEGNKNTYKQTVTTNSTGSVTYTSSDEAVATVAEDGTVSVVKGGTVTITANVAAVADTWNASSAEYTLTIKKMIPTVTSGDNFTLYVGESVDVSTLFTTSSDGVKSYSLSSSNYGSIVDGIYTVAGYPSSSSYVNVHLTTAETDIYAAKTTTASTGSQRINLRPLVAQTISFEKSSYTFALNEEVADFTNTLTGAKTTVNYSSSDENIATVNEDGLVHVVSTAHSGTVTITATAISEKVDGVFYKASNSESFTITIKHVAPTFSLAAGEYHSDQLLEISATDAMTIYYTTNGADVTFDTANIESNGTEYNGGINLAKGTTTVKAIAVYSDGENYFAGAQASYTYSLVAPAAPTLSVADKALINLGDSITISAAEGTTVTYIIIDENAVTIAEGTNVASPVQVKIDKAGSFTIEASATWNIENGYKSDNAEITFKVAGPASIPFAYNDNASNLPTCFTKVDAKNVADYKTENAKIALKAAGTAIILWYDSEADILSFDAMLNGTWNEANEFVVSTSANGRNWTELHTFTGSNDTLTGSATTYTFNLPSTARYIKWEYETKSSGNVGFGNIILDKNYSRTMSLTEGQTKWGTICLPYAVAAEDRSGAEYYNILGVTKEAEEISGIVLGKEEGTLVAGKPYIFKATADLYCPYSGSPASAPIEATGLVGNYTGNAQVPANCYILSSNKIRMVQEGATAYVGPNRAYLDLAGVAEYTEGSEANAIRFGFDGQVEDYSTYIQSVQYNAEESVLIFDLQGHKVQTMKPGQLYIVNGKKMFNK